MSIIINDIEFDTSKIIALIAKGKKLQAIKNVRNQLKVGLYQSKIIVENLEQNPNFYDGKPHTIAHDFPDMDTKKEKPRAKRGSHIIVNKTSQTKNYIIFILVICIGVLLYLYLGK